MTATATDPGTPPRTRRKLVLAVLAVVLLLTGGGAAVLLLGGEAEAEETAPPPADGPVVPVADMTATLAGPGIHYAKVAFSAVLTTGADEALVASRFDLLRDAAITELSTISADHLRTTAGMEELRARLSDRAGALYPDGEVLRVVLTELIVQ